MCKNTKTRKKTSRKGCDVSSPRPGELARRLDKETRGQRQRFLNKNKKNVELLPITIHVFSSYILTYLKKTLT